MCKCPACVSLPFLDASSFLPLSKPVSQSDPAWKLRQSCHQPIPPQSSPCCNHLQCTPSPANSFLFWTILLLTPTLFPQLVLATIISKQMIHPTLCYLSSLTPSLPTILSSILLQVHEHNLDFGITNGATARVTSLQSNYYLFPVPQVEQVLNPTTTSQAQIPPPVPTPHCPP